MNNHEYTKQAAAWGEQHKEITDGFRAAIRDGKVTVNLESEDNK